MVARSRSALTQHSTEAVLLRKLPHGEADLIVNVYTERLGRISALARSALRSRKRFGGALEPMHTLFLELDERKTSELFSLREASIRVPRLGLTQDLERMQAAGRGLTWIRQAAPPRSAEPEVWHLVRSLLDVLDQPGSESPELSLASFGLRLLIAFGWGLELERCVRCDKPCEPGRSAMIDPRKGGLVCRACGGARRIVDGDTRERFVELSQGAAVSLGVPQLQLLLGLVEATLREHAGVQ